MPCRKSEACGGAARIYAALPKVAPSWMSHVMALPVFGVGLPKASGIARARPCHACISVACGGIGRMFGGDAQGCSLAMPCPVTCGGAPPSFMWHYPKPCLMWWFVWYLAALPEVVSCISLVPVRQPPPLVQAQGPQAEPETSTDWAIIIVPMPHRGL